MGMSQIPIGWLMKIEGFNNRFTPEKQPVCLMIDGINQLPAALFFTKRTSGWFSQQKPWVLASIDVRGFNGLVWENHPQKYATDISQNHRIHR